MQYDNSELKSEHVCLNPSSTSWSAKRKLHCNWNDASFSISKCISVKHMNRLKKNLLIYKVVYSTPGIYLAINYMGFGLRKWVQILFCQAGSLMSPCITFHMDKHALVHSTGSLWRWNRILCGDCKTCLQIPWHTSHWDVRPESRALNLGGLMTNSGSELCDFWN